MASGIAVSLYFFGCKIVISPLFTGMITLMLLIDTTGLMGLLLATMLIHEAGHLFFMAWFGCLPKEICFLPFEIKMVAEKTPAIRFQQVLVSAGGILANLLTCLISFGDFRVVNLFLACFNGLPVFSMDGYQLLVVLCSFFDKLQWIPQVCSWITITCLAVFGAWSLIHSRNPSLLLFCLYMGILTLKTKRHG
jgi:Zn-dependent protease